jgi:putative Holliday junction resolvase
MNVASLDIGLKRVGVAILLNNIIIPQEAFIRKNRNQVAKEIDIFLEKWNIDILVIGIPLGGDGEDEMRRRIKHFSSLLKFDKKISFIDESFSSFEAKDIMKGKTKIKRDGRVDSISAKIILERWIEENKDVFI